MRLPQLDIFRCPACKGKLTIASIARRMGEKVLRGTLCCDGCGETYPIVGGYPILLRRGFVRSSLRVEEVLRKVGREEFARLLLEDKLPSFWGTYADSASELVTRKEIRRGGQLASLRLASKRDLHASMEAERYLLDALDLRAEDRVLDSCTGGGCLLSEIVKRMSDTNPAFALDIMYETLKYAEGELRKLGAVDRTAFGAGDARYLPFADDSFDCVASAAGYDHVEGYGKAVEEAWRILRPGGRFGFMANTRRTVWGLEDLLTDEQQKTVLERKGIALGKEQMLDALGSSGFRLSRVDDFEAGWGNYYICVAVKPS